MCADENALHLVTPSTSVPVNVMADSQLTTTSIPVPPVAPVLDGFVVGAAGAPSFSLDRLYPVYEFTWTASQVQNTAFRINFPDVLFSQSFIQDKLANFTYFRASVAFSFRLSGNKFNYGSFIASWDPATIMDYSAAGYSDSNLWTSSGFPHMLVQANDVETPEMTIPFVFPQTALVARNQGTSEIGSLDITIVNPLTTISSVVSPSVQVTVYARFTNIVLDGPTEATTTMTHAAPLLY